MTQPRILCLSNPMGLGHITRDLAIIQQLRKLARELDIIWLTSEPNLTLLARVGEQVHPLSAEMRSPTDAAERRAERGFHYDSRRNYRVIRRIQWHNASMLRSVLADMNPDLVFGDEAVEVLMVLARNPELKHWPFVLITDAHYPVNAEPLQSINRSAQRKVCLARRRWVRYMERFRSSGMEPYSMLYVGTSRDIPDSRMGPGLPRLRSFFLRHFQPIGYILPFDASRLLREGRARVKSRLGYSPRKRLIVASVGGLGIGREFLERVDAAVSELATVAGGALEVVFVCGPRLAPENIPVSSRIVQVRGYLPRLYEHFAAADFAIIKTGLTSAIELAYVGTPFVHVPIPGHVEEEFEVASRLKRLGLGRKLSFQEMTPKNLARAFREALASHTRPAEIPTNGAELAAKLMLKLLSPSAQAGSIRPTPVPVPSARS